jgi:hypothetical protein
MQSLDGIAGTSYLEESLAVARDSRIDKSLGRLRGVRVGSAAHNAVGLAGESSVVGSDCLLLDGFAGGNLTRRDARDPPRNLRNQKLGW